MLLNMLFLAFTIDKVPFQRFSDQKRWHQSTKQNYSTALLQQANSKQAKWNWAFVFFFQLALERTCKMFQIDTMPMVQTNATQLLTNLANKKTYKLQSLLKVSHQLIDSEPYDSSFSQLKYIACFITIEYLYDLNVGHFWKKKNSLSHAFILNK